MTGPVGRGEDEDLAAFLQPVEEGEELRHHGLLVVGISRPSGQAEGTRIASAEYRVEKRESCKMGF